jgi:diguanylate cyclase (GGDEF)-like protein/PAS domain S-box-containing protein
MITTLEDYLNVIQENSFFNNFFDSLYEGIFIINNEKKVIFWNKSAEIITGYNRDSVMNTTCDGEKFVHIDKNGNKINIDEYPVIKCLQQGEVINQKSIIIHEKGFMVPVLISAIPLKDKEGNIIGAAETILDDTAHEDLEKAHERIRESATKDPLTAHLTRAEIVNRVNIEMEKADRYEMPLCLCICDIDNFKKINENWGNIIGDAIIKTAGETLRNHLRRTDLIGRYSNDQFLILLPLIDMHRAWIAIEKLQKKFNELEIEAINNGKISLSFGLTEILQDDSVEDFIDRAESALYKAKKLGKNRIEIFR